MNNIEEAKIWFLNIMKGCYLKKLDKYPGWIFWVYDKNLIRQRKLSKITEEYKINLDMSNGEIIFEQDEKNGDFYIKYDNYWEYLELNFNLVYMKVRELTSNVVNEVLNSKQYTTVNNDLTGGITVNEVLNSKQYTTDDRRYPLNIQVNEVLNCKQYSTLINEVQTDIGE
jgi:hypothetical protein